MKVVLVLAILVPLAAVVAWYASRPIILRKQRIRRIEELETENARLDELLKEKRSERG
jgi:hypothetical protein